MAVGSNAEIDPYVVVLSKNILEGPADEIRETTVDYTIVEGEGAYARVIFSEGAKRPWEW